MFLFYTVYSTVAVLNISKNYAKKVRLTNFSELTIPIGLLFGFSRVFIFINSEYSKGDILKYPNRNI